MFSQYWATSVIISLVSRGKTGDVEDKKMGLKSVKVENPCSMKPFECNKNPANNQMDVKLSINVLKRLSKPQY